MKPESNRPAVRLQWRGVVGFALTFAGVLSLVLYFLHVIG